MEMVKMNKYKLVVLILVFFAFNVDAGYQATHDVLFDGDSYPPFVTEDSHFNIETVKYSKNGNRIVFYGRSWQNSSPYGSLGFRAYIIDFDGANIHQIPLPQRDDGFSGPLDVKDFVINDDGTIIYLSTYGTSASQTGGTYSIPNKIYRIDVTTSPINTTVTQIADIGFLHGYLNYAPLLQTTSAGDWVYYTNSNNLVDGGHDDVYRLSSTGAIFDTVVQDFALQLTVASSSCQGRGDYVSNEGFSISGDGSKILFRLRTIYNDSVDCMYDQNWWVLKSSAGDVLLNPANEIGYDGGILSADGSTIVIADDYNYYSYDGDGSSQLLIQPQSYNYQGPSITADGSHYFYRDNIHPYGMILNTNGNGALSILPKYWSMGAPAINNIGNQITYTGGRRIFAGRLYSNGTDSVAPIITDISFEPEYIIEGNTDPVVIKVTTHSVVGEIAEVKINNMTNGRFVASDADYSHYFRWDPQDNGFGGDVTAGDGIYSNFSTTWNNGDFNNPTSITIRISVVDTLGNVRVVEKPLYVGVFTNGFE